MNVTVPPQLRAEDEWGNIGDIVITCNGGSISNPGLPVPKANITVTLNMPIANPVGSSGVPDALLLIDEPETVPRALAPLAGFGPNAPFTFCTTPTCPAYRLLSTIPTSGSNSLVVTNAASSPSSTPTTAANVFNGIVSGNSVTFIGVPIDPPGTTGARVYRIINVKSKVSGLLPGGGSATTFIVAAVSSSSPTAFPINNPIAIAGSVSPGVECNNGSVQFGRSFAIHNPSRSTAALGRIDFNGAGHLDYIANVRVDDKVSQRITGTGEYFLSPMLSGFCGGTLELPGLPQGLNSFSVRVLPHKGIIEMDNVAPNGASGFAEPPPTGPACSASTISGNSVLGIDIVAGQVVHARAVGALNLDATTNAVTFVGDVIGEGTVLPGVSALGTYTLENNCLGTLNFPGGLPGITSWGLTLGMEVHEDATDAPKAFNFMSITPGIVATGSGKN